MTTNGRRSSLRLRGKEGTPVPLKRKRSLLGNNITVIVDEDASEKTFTLRQDLFCQRSKLLRRLCAEERWSEAEKSIRLSNPRAIDFDTYVSFCTSNSQPEVHALAKAQCDLLMVENTTAYDRTSLHVATLMELWCLGDYLQDTGFKNAVMDGLLEVDLGGFGGAAVAACTGLVTGCTPGNSKLCKLLVDVLSPMIDEDFIDEMSEQWPKDFTVALLKKMVTLRGGKKREALPVAGDREKYHDGEDSEVEQDRDEDEDDDDE